MRGPWTAKRSNQSILKEITPEYALKELMLKLKLQYVGHLIQRTDPEKDPDAGKNLGQEEKGTVEDEMVAGHHHSMGMSLRKLQESAMHREAWRTVVHGVAKS